MELYPEYAFAAASAVAVLGLLAVLLRSRRGASGHRSTSREVVIEHECNVCGRDMVFTFDQLRPLAGVEIGLVVSARPDLQGQKLAEYVCPYCETAHCFVTGKRQARWADSNIYQPETKRARCMECRRVLQKAPWPTGMYDGRLAEAPSLPPELGLTCPRCQAVVCLECCAKNTHGAATPGLYRCPRCNRRSVDRVFAP